MGFFGGIEKKIKKAVKNTSSLKVDDFDVEEKDDVCTLTGRVTKKWMAMHIEEIAKEQGAKKIINNIKYPETTGGATGAAKPEMKTHTVVSGDTLGAIAKKFYGDWKKYTLIFEANRDILDDPNKIDIGQVLKIPELEE